MVMGAIAPEGGPTKVPRIAKGEFEFGHFAGATKTAFLSHSGTNGQKSVAR